MKKKVHQYEGDEILVTYDAARCIHAASCVHGLPGVFDSERRPWVEPNAAAADEVAAVVASCPTGALRYERRDRGEAEPAPAENEARLVPDGPLYLRGDLEIERADGTVEQEIRVALCRCGASKNKPYCDNSHREIGFRDAGAIGAGRLVPAPADDPAPAATGLTLKVRPDGPLLVQGPLTIRSADGGTEASGVKGALCRCGASNSKPFCDGSHVAAGFKAD